MDNHWIYKDKEFKVNNLDQFWGFVYKITNLKTGHFYYGSKQFFSRTNGKISKKRSNELYSGKGRKQVREKKIKEADWKTYKSSSKKVLEMLENSLEDFKFEILQLHTTKQEMLLSEMLLIGKEFIKRNPLILNEWISIKSFRLK